uniref:Uncharacterized protein n=1 Tax=Rhizophora mucronata TaxID=61149 RepID=A0A2P2K5U6_RHIMU
MAYLFIGGKHTDHASDGQETFSCSYDLLKEIDPTAAKRVHPNNHRKVRLPVDPLFFCPSKLDV